VRALALLAALALPAAALDVEREEYKLIGWNDACSAALERYAFPKSGGATLNEPIMTRVGTLSIIARKPDVETRWALEAGGDGAYDKLAVEALRGELRKAGYDRPGFEEDIRDAALAEPPGPAAVILSTAILQARSGAWPDPRRWRWGRTHYNPLGTCALLVYEQIGARGRFQFVLTRIDNARARADRARAHTTNGRLLLNNGDLAGALAETEIGARTAPEAGITRYHYAALLALSGRIDDAMRELLAAVERDGRLAGKAAKDEDFDALRKRQDFRELILERGRR
jgi:tetratricopeptide (TPR) repeat protein